jgi:hypothetical protein
MALDTSPASVLSYRERGQTIEIAVEAERPALLVVNQTYFRGWIARSERGELRTIPVNIDRLGIIVPPHTSHVTLRFGRYRRAVAASWLLSTALLFFAVLGSLRAVGPLSLLAVEELDGRSGQIEGAGHEDAARI